jgi:hypothetical protein
MDIIAPSDPSDPVSGPFLNRPFHAEAARPCRMLYIPGFGDAPVDPEMPQSLPAPRIGCAILATTWKQVWFHLMLPVSTRHGQYSARPGSPG